MGAPIRAAQEVGDGSAGAAAMATKRQLRRLPHVFCKWVELPFAEDAEVEVIETRESYSLAVRQAGLREADVAAEAVEIVPGVVKVALRGEEKVRAMLRRAADMEPPASGAQGGSWRARLPPCADAEAAASSYAGGVITITIPKLASSGRPSPLRCCNPQEVKRSLRCLA